MNAYGVRQRVLKVAGNVYSKGEIKAADDLSLTDDLGFDSIQVLQFLVGIEKEFSVAIEIEYFDTRLLGSLNSFSAYVAALTEKVE